jgi:hypothetical protein
MIRQTVLPFKLERTDETLTAHGGLALLAEYTHALGLRALVARHLPRPGSNRGYASAVFVETVILLLQAGGRTLEDLRDLEREDALLTLLGHEALPDPDTVGDWLRRRGDPQTGQAGLEGLGQVRDALSARLVRRDGVEAYTLDVDATLVEAELINALQADTVRWAITADQDAAVKALLRQLPEDAWTAPVPGCGYELAEAVHTMEKTTVAFRLICKREIRRQLALFDAPGTPYAYHVIATNWPEAEKSAQAVLDWHNQRGQAENFTKELKHGVGLERVPCGETWANAVWFRLGVIAYNLIIGFKRLVCPTAWARHTTASQHSLSLFLGDQNHLTGGGRICDT